MKLASAILLATLVLQVLPVSAERDRESPLSEAAKVVVGGEGVISEQARLLASMYMVCYISGCGGVEAPSPHRDYWEARVRFGVAGTPAGSIRIDRRTAAISYKGKPTIYPKDFARWAKLFEQRRGAP